jgi:7-keto-8-aminopelargonate synthetase-like enzyme
MHRTSPPGGITGLCRRIRSQRDIWMVEQYIARTGGVHLKDVTIGPMDDQRRMTVDGRQVVNFGCDSYLGLDRDPRIQKAFLESVPSWGLHSGASRMFYSVELYNEAERRLAEWMGVDDTLIFPSVSLANFGVLPGIVHPGDTLIVDRRSHDSLHQAAGVAASAGVRVHTEIARTDILEPIVQPVGDAGLVLAVDGVYSMTGDSPPLAELDLLLRRSGGTLYVDDAHSTGVVGPKGRGVAAEILPSSRSGRISAATSTKSSSSARSPRLFRAWAHSSPARPS